MAKVEENNHEQEIEELEQLARVHQALDYHTKQLRTQVDQLAADFQTQRNQLLRRILDERGLGICREPRHEYEAIGLRWVGIFPISEMELVWHVEKDIFNDSFAWRSYVYRYCSEHAKVMLAQQQQSSLNVENPNADVYYPVQEVDGIFVPQIRVPKGFKMPTKITERPFTEAMFKLHHIPDFFESTK